MAKNRVEQWDETIASNTDVGGTSLVESVATVDTLDTIFGTIMSQVAKHFGEDTIASAATTDLSTVPGQFVNVTGTTAITAFGTETAGCTKFLLFAGILTLTHNGTSLILPTGANITTAAGDMFMVTSEGSGNWRCTGYMRADGTALAGGLSNVVEDTTPQLGGALDGQGEDITGIGVLTMVEQAAAEADVAGRGQIWVKTATPNQLWFTDDAGTDARLVVASDLVGQQAISMPAGAMTPTTTNGAEQTTEELATNDVMKSYLAYDDSTEEYGCFDIWMPKGWDEGTLVCQFAWYGTATTGDVIWGIQAVAVGDDDAQDAAYGTAVEVTDTAKGTANDNTLSGETSAMTVGGTPGSEELVQFKVYRKAADGSDTFSGDAKLTAVKIHYTTDALTDD